MDLSLDVAWSTAAGCGNLTNETVNATFEDHDTELRLTNNGGKSSSNNTWIYILVGAVAVALIIVGVICCLKSQSNEDFQNSDFEKV